MKLGLNPEEQTRIFDQILDGNGKVLEKIRTGSPELEDTLLPLLNLQGHSAQFLKNLKALAVQNFPEISPHLEDFINVVELLEALGYNYKIDIASGAGFEYYTGAIFQLFVDKEKIGGGGRYDSLIPTMGGKDIPASGFALYLDRLLKLVKPEIMSQPAPQRILVRVKGGTADLVKKTFAIANRLHEAGYVAELDLTGMTSPNLRWVLDIRSETPAFVLTDMVRHSKEEVQGVEEILTLLGEKGADKNSLT